MQQSRLAPLILVLIIVLFAVTFFVLSNTTDDGVPPENVTISRAEVSGEPPEKKVPPEKESADSFVLPRLEKATLPPARSRDYEIQVLRPSGTPIGGASIEVSPGRAGVTGEYGRFPISIEDSDWPIQIDVVAAGFARKNVEFSIPDDEELITIRLDPISDAIHGRVVIGSEKEPAGSGIHVVAWATRIRAPSWGTLRSLFEGDAPEGVLLAETDDAGLFLFEGLDTAERYSLIAGGGGSSTLESTEGVLPGTDDTVLAAIGLFGAALRFTQVGQVELRNKNGMQGVHFVTASKAGLHRIAYQSPACALNGFLSEASPEMRFLFFLKDTTQEELGPLETVCSVPGYNKHLVRFIAHRAIGQIAIQDVELSPFGDRMGAIEVIFDGWSGTPSPNSSVPAGEIHLTNHSTYLRYPVKTLFQDSQLIEGVPQGFYNVAFQTKGGFLRQPKSKKEKGPVPLHLTDVIARLPFEVEHLGALGVTIRDGARLYDGGVWIYLTESSDGIDPHRHGLSDKPSDFREPPYVIEGIPYGTYDLSVQTPGAGASEPNSGSWSKAYKNVIVPRQSTKWIEIDIRRK